MAFQRRAVFGRPYQLFIPRAAAEGPLPLVVFLHGVGENGNDGEKHLKVGLPVHVQKNAATFPALVLAPQCAGPWKYVGADEQVVLEAIEATRRERRVDPSRIYLTGLSQGGCSAFELGAKYPEKWAALVVVCGAGRPADAMRLRRTPVRIYHGEKDDVVPPSGHHRFDDVGVGGRDMAAFLPHAKYVEFPGAGHAIWDEVYGNPELWTWLFAQKRP
ncbi:MAG TPA: PHB depolymerase family esterase [Planctomycetota bacterium]|nr:PHB depolymerase family esterase [Planctomycetota bacterium]